jgi:hypothetical protein
MLILSARCHGHLQSTQRAGSAQQRSARSTYTAEINDGHGGNNTDVALAGHHAQLD